MLARRNGETTFIAIPSTVRLMGWPPYLTVNFEQQGVDFLYNVQHDCPLSKCTASGKQPLIQERVESGKVKACIEHQPIERFIVNTHAFHNAHLIRASLPRLLIAPIPLHQDRQSKHFEIAGGFRAAQEVKRTANKARKNLAIQNPAGQTGGGSNKRQRLDTGEDLNAVVQV